MPQAIQPSLVGQDLLEIGRQPWVVYGLLRTKDAVSAHGDLHMSISLLAFIIVYCSVFGVGYSYMMRLIRKGPQPHEHQEDNTEGRPARPLSAVNDTLDDRS